MTLPNKYLSVCPEELCSMKECRQYLLKQCQRLFHSRNSRKYGFLCLRRLLRCGRAPQAPWVTFAAGLGKPPPEEWAFGGLQGLSPASPIHIGVMRGLVQPHAELQQPRGLPCCCNAGLSAGCRKRRTHRHCRTGSGGWRGGSEPNPVPLLISHSF